MRNDPFSVLDVQPGATKAELAKAFAGARSRGVDPAEARKAFDFLRDPIAAEAISILAVSRTPGYRALLASGQDDAAIEAAVSVMSVAAAFFADLEVYLGSQEVMPAEVVTRDVREYVPAVLDDLEP